MELYPSLITDALRTVRYPGTGKNIVDMGIVADDLRIAGLHVSFTMVFDRPTDPFLRSLVKAAEAAIHAHVSHDITVEIATRTATAGSPEAPAAPDYSHLGRIIAVSSGKGGVGKSTVAVNLAVSLAAQGFRVGLLDCDIYGPSVPKMLGIEDARPYSEERDGKTLIVPVEACGLKVISIGFFVDTATPTLWRGGMATGALKQLIGEVAWGELDYFVLDTPPGTSDIHLTLVQTLPIAGALIVTTPQQVALADARKGMHMYTNEKINIPILGIVENMAWFTPAEHPAERYYIFGRDAATTLALEEHTPLLAQIPLVAGMSEEADAGRPAVNGTSEPTAQAFASLAATIAAMLPTP